ncbi:MAG: PEP-CTERM sorting domain-containing protein [Kiritimatiellia bacterium]
MQTKTTLSLLAALTLGLAASLHADVITYAFDSDSKVPTTDTYADANGGTLTGVGFTLTDSNFGNPAPSVGAPLDEIATNLDLATDYYTFTISKDAGATDYGLASISFEYQVNHSNTVHTTNFSLFSSVTGFSNAGQQIASFEYDGTAGSAFLNTGTINLGASFSGLTTDTEFRIYLDDNGSGSGATYAKIDNVSISAVPEPGTLALLGLSGLALLAGLRRRKA